MTQQPLNFQTLRAAAGALPSFIDVDIPELGGAIRLRRLTAVEAVEFSRFVSTLSDDSTGVSDPEKMHVAQVDFIARAAIDGDKNQFLDTKEGRELIGSLPPGTIGLLFNEGQKLSGMAPRVEAAKKN